LIKSLNTTEAILNEKKFKNRSKAWKYKLLKKNTPNMEFLLLGVCRNSALLDYFDWQDFSFVRLSLLFG